MILATQSSQHWAGSSDGAGATRQKQAFNNNDADAPIYSTDEFRMYCFKVMPCSKRFSHDWVSCPFAHPGERARRRCVRSNSYGPAACPDVQKDGSCPRGDACSFTHNVFEFHLHPQRYRTQWCHDGSKCTRKICFFAHSLEELR
ncbi:hypothetical protein OEZ85_003220 [Tetradesmus obliquus]|uniref:C3H1-type domain-containing protein n=1 Tax=Tetradesmus obliquus TaxID=3088 RepID=A0ABY8U432_TETOB|nr:hypothetical protein OEZ85_003220 [Tetradesmus obliquus]